MGDWAKNSAWTLLTYPALDWADWSSFQAMEAEQGPGIQAGFPQVGTLLARLAINVLWKIKRLRPAIEYFHVQIELANFAAMAESGPSQESPTAENWCFTQVTDHACPSCHLSPGKQLR